MASPYKDYILYEVATHSGNQAFKNAIVKSGSPIYVKAETRNYVLVLVNPAFNLPKCVAAPEFKVLSVTRINSFNQSYTIPPTTNNALWQITRQGPCGSDDEYYAFIVLAESECQARHLAAQEDTTFPELWLSNKWSTCGIYHPDIGCETSGVLSACTMLEKIESDKRDAEKEKAFLESADKALLEDKEGIEAEKIMKAKKEQALKDEQERADRATKEAEAAKAAQASGAVKTLDAKAVKAPAAKAGKPPKAPKAAKTPAAAKAPKTPKAPKAPKAAKTPKTPKATKAVEVVEVVEEKESTEKADSTDNTETTEATEDTETTETTHLPDYPSFEDADLAAYIRGEGPAPQDKEEL
jgi:hypothetical protein